METILIRKIGGKTGLRKTINYVNANFKWLASEGFAIISGKTKVSTEASKALGANEDAVKKTLPAKVAVIKEEKKTEKPKK